VGRRTALAFENRLRTVRESRGWTQAELARACGLSRQALSAIESGRYVPNTAVALRLAQALGCAVEDLFAPRRGAGLDVVLGQPADPSSRVVVGRVRQRLVAWPLRGYGSSVPADGIVGDRCGQRARVTVLPGAVHPDRVLLLAGCDPALRVAGCLLERQGGVRVHWLPVGSVRALRAARQGLVHVAGTHLHPPQDPEGWRVVRRWLRDTPAVMVTVARWVEGLMLRPGLSKQVRRPEDLFRPGLRVVNREQGSGSRLVFDRWLRAAGVSGRRLEGYGLELDSHLSVAEAVAGGLADAGPGVLPVARWYGLDFLPIADERYDLVVPQDLVDAEPVQRFLDVVTGRRFRQELLAIGGYDLGPAGTVRAVPGEVGRG
jgi:putative molybdopterin biosynthesis protein